MRFLVLNNRKIVDLEAKEISSWEYVDKEKAEKEYGWEDAFYMVYYFDENKGKHLERDNKGGHSMDNFDASEVLATCDTLEELLIMETVSIPKKEYEELKKAKEDLKECKEALERKEDLLKRLLTPYVEAKIPPDVFEQISNNKFIKNKIEWVDCIEDPSSVQINNIMIVKRSERL